MANIGVRYAKGRKMNSKQKGAVGHRYTVEWLTTQGWSCWVKPHQDTVFNVETMQHSWRSTGSNDIFAAPDTDNKNKKVGGFDILAVRKTEYMLVQVKKTKANPITPKLISITEYCADYWCIPKENCCIMWWGDGDGPAKGPTTTYFLKEKQK